jgi:hypothetical protein
MTTEAPDNTISCHQAIRARVLSLSSLSPYSSNPYTPLHHFHFEMAHNAPPNSSVPLNSPTPSIPTNPFITSPISHVYHPPSRNSRMTTEERRQVSMQRSRQRKKKKIPLAPAAGTPTTSVVFPSSSLSTHPLPPTIDLTTSNTLLFLFFPLHVSYHGCSRQHTHTHHYISSCVDSQRRFPNHWSLIVSFVV